MRQEQQRRKVATSAVSEGAAPAAAAAAAAAAALSSADTADRRGGRSGRPKKGSKPSPEELERQKNGALRAAIRSWAEQLKLPRNERFKTQNEVTGQPPIHAFHVVRALLSSQSLASPPPPTLHPKPSFSRPLSLSLSPPPPPQCIQEALAECHSTVTINHGYVSTQATKLIDNETLTIDDLRIGSHGPPPLLELIEPAIVEMLLNASKRGHHLYASELCELTYYFLEGTEESLLFKDNEVPGMPTRTWAEAFLDRHRDKLEVNLGNRKALCRMTWATWDNMNRWLIFLERRFVQYKVAVPVIDPATLQQLSIVVHRPGKLHD